MRDTNGRRLLATEQKNSNCPYCVGKKTIVGINDLQTVNLELVKEWLYEKNDILPQQVKAGSNTKVWWMGVCGHEWEMKISDRSKGVGCPYCSGKRVLIGYNDLQTTNSKIAKEWYYEKNGNLNPTNITSGSSKKVWWRCDRDHTWEATISSRTNGNGCPYCARRIAWMGENDIITTHPEVAFYWDYDRNYKVNIYEIVAGSEKVVLWKCKEGYSWKNSVKRQVAKNICPICEPNNREKIWFWHNNPTGNKSQCAEELNIIFPQSVNGGIVDL